MKPYRFIEDKTLQLVLTNLSDLVIDELVQIKEPKPLFIENANCGLIKFEPINNYLTHGNIIGTNVHVHYHNDVLIEFNCVLNYNDQNDTFSKGSIDLYTLEVYNPKSYIYSPL